MTKQLIRGTEVPQNAEILSSSEFMKLSLDQIASTALSVKDANETEPVLNAMSDILDLMCTYLITKNIDPTALFEHAVEVRKTQGSFEKKAAVTKE